MRQGHFHAYNTEAPGLRHGPRQRNGGVCAPAPNLRTSCQLMTPTHAPVEGSTTTQGRTLVIFPARGSLQPIGPGRKQCASLYTGKRLQLSPFRRSASAPLRDTYSPASGMTTPDLLRKHVSSNQGPQENYRLYIDQSGTMNAQGFGPAPVNMGTIGRALPLGRRGARHRGARLGPGRRGTGARWGRQAGGRGAGPQCTRS
jgi:hypothetical protein